MRILSRIRAFSLVELVIVVVIIGVIAAIAVPRISRGARGANESALRGDLAALRNCIDLYAAEHGGTFPSAGSFDAQVTTFTDDGGVTSTTKDATYKYGPYLRALPGLPVAGAGGILGGKLGDTKVEATDALGVGWLYTVLTGTIVANTGTAEDEATTLYSDY
jgi:prepilin-type N-terminal cleavage/methylation domain-containing protein